MSRENEVTPPDHRRSDDDPAPYAPRGGDDLAPEVTAALAVLTAHLQKIARAERERVDAQRLKKRVQLSLVKKQSA